MPTRHRRVPVTLDEELAGALERVEAIRGRTAPRSRLLRDLALRGAEAVVDEAAERQRTLAALAELSTTSDALFDRDVLLRLDEEAWQR